jgi:hypothetical protein
MKYLVTTVKKNKNLLDIFDAHYFCSYLFAVARECLNFDSHRQSFLFFKVLNFEFYNKKKEFTKFKTFLLF